MIKQPLEIEKKEKEIKWEVKEVCGDCGKGKCDVISGKVLYKFIRSCLIWNQKHK